MPWIYTIDKKRDAILTTGTGVLTDSDFRAGVEQLFSDPDFNPDTRVLSDFTAITGTKITAEALSSFAKAYKFSANSRRALLTKRGINEAFAKFYQLHVTAGRVRVFLDRTEALAWLNDGVPSEKILT